MVDYSSIGARKWLSVSHFQSTSSFLHHVSSNPILLLSSTCADTRDRDTRDRDTRDRDTPISDTGYIDKSGNGVVSLEEVVSRVVLGSEKECWIVMGNEKEGVSQQILQASHHLFTIPTPSSFSQSLNLSVSTGECVCIDRSMSVLNVCVY